MKRDGGFPPVPGVAFSLLGLVEVSQFDLEGLFGITHLMDRIIALREGMNLAVAWSTYWHEVAHLVLFDAGVKLGAKEESVCDAFGNLAAAVRSGFLKVSNS